MHRRASHTLALFVVGILFLVLSNQSKANSKKDPFNVSLCLTSLVQGESNSNRTPVPMMSQLAEFGFGPLLSGVAPEQGFSKFEYESFVFHAANGFQSSELAELTAEKLVGQSVASVSALPMLLAPHFGNHNVTLINASRAQKDEETAKYDLVLAQGHYGSLNALAPLLKRAHSLRKPLGELRFRLMLPASIDLASALLYFRDKATAEPIVTGIRAWLKSTLGNTAAESFALMLTGSEYQVELATGPQEVGEDDERYAWLDDSRYMVEQRLPTRHSSHKGRFRVDRRRVSNLQQHLVINQSSEENTVGHGASVALTVIVRGVEPSMWDSFVGWFSSEWSSVW